MPTTLLVLQVWTILKQHNTDKAERIIRKHKDDISIFPNKFWDEESIINLII